jgi:hypothetical protein
MSRAQRGHLLIRAAGQGQIPALAAFAAAEAGLIKTYGEEALFEACEKGRLEAVQWLHEKGIRLDGFHFDQDTPHQTIENYPFHCAAGGGHFAILGWLMDKGVTPSVLPRLLGRTAGVDAALFARLLRAHPYIDAWRSGRNGEWQERGEAQMAESFDGALRAIAGGGFLDAARAALAAGLQEAELYREAMQLHGAPVLQMLLVQGFRPDAALSALHAAHLEDSSGTAAENMRGLLAAWGRAAAPLSLTAEQARRYAAAIAADPAAMSDEDGMPAALALARAGLFAEAVAPLLPRHGAALLLAACSYGSTVGDVAAARGELAAAFSPQIWQGQAEAAARVIESLPPVLRTEAALGQVRMGVQMRDLHRGGRGLKLRRPGGGRP